MTTNIKELDGDGCTIFNRTLRGTPENPDSVTLYSDELTRIAAVDVGSLGILFHSSPSRYDGSVKTNVLVVNAERTEINTAELDLYTPTFPFILSYMGE